VLGVLGEAVLVQKLGIVGLVVPVALLVLVIPLSNPRIALGLLVGCTILFEASTPNVLHFTTDQIQDPLPGHYGLLELLMALAVCSVVLDASRRRRVPLRPVPFGPVLGLLVFALLCGALVGHYAGEGFNAVTEQLRGILPLIIVPWVTVNAIRDAKDLRRTIGLIGIMTVVKAVLGLLAVLTHVGNGVGTQTITYYEPTANWLTMAFILTMLAAVAARLPVERVARWASLLVVLCLALSLRRSFWLGTAAAVPVVLVVTMSRFGKRLLVPAAVVLAAVLWISISSGFVTDNQPQTSGGSVVQRLASLNPSKLTSNPEDRYRLDERKNVLAEIRASPLVGLGMAVPWQERYPLSVEATGGRLYVHMAVLWYWLKLGVLGVIAYIGYMLTGIVVGIQVFRRHRDPRIRIAGAGAAAALVGLVVVEATATFLGADLRLTMLIGCVVGLLSAARTQAQSQGVATPSPRISAGPVSAARLRSRHPFRQVT
jgi:hypothetical protein